MGDGRPMCSVDWYKVVKKTLVVESYFLLCDSDNHCSTYVAAHLKEECLHSKKTVPNFTGLIILLWMDTRFKSLDIVYKLPKEKQGPAVFLLSPQNICQCVRHLSIVDISWAEGLKLITDKLDEIYSQDLNTSTYIAFKDFYSYKRDIDVNINDFLMHYCIRNYKNLLWLSPMMRRLSLC